MTLRAFLLGLFGACSIAGITYYNNYVLRQTDFIGYFLPPTIFGGLLLFLVAINPLLGKLRASWPFSARELVFILAMALTSGGLGGSNLGAFFTPILMLPHSHAQVEIGWNENQLLERLPGFMLADPGPDQEALGAFREGAGAGSGIFTPADIPWHAWLPTLSFWIPLLLFMMVGLLALALVFHRQWAHHEHLPYPIVQIFNKFLPDENGKRSEIFTKRAFWIAAAVVLGAHLNNFAASLNPDLIEIPLQVDFSPLRYNLPPAWQLNTLRQTLIFNFIFSVIAIAFLIPRGTSFSLALAPWVANGILGIGMIATGATWEINGVVEGSNFFKFGTFFGLACAVLFTGRYYYLATFCQSLKLPFGPSATAAGVHAEAILGMRVFLICMTGFVIMLMIAGLDWLLAVTLMAVIIIIYIALGRVIAETGAIFYNVAISGAILVTGIFGTDMIGPTAFLIMALVTGMFFQDAKEALMPFVVNALRFLDVRNLPMRKASGSLSLVLILGIIVVAVTSLYFIYLGGTVNIEERARTQSSVVPFKQTLTHLQFLSSQGTLESAAAATPVARLLSLELFSTQSLWFLAGLALVLGFSAARLRFAWWPLHPIMFVIMLSWGAAVCSGSFLIGWFIKTVTLKFGGQTGYRQVTPMILGLMAGELVAILLINIINYLILLITGEPPLSYNALPI